MVILSVKYYQMKKIFIVYDNVVNKDSEVYKRLLDLNRFHHYNNNDWEVVITQNIEETLDSLSEKYTGKVIISALGHFIRYSFVRDDFIEESKDHALVGHIIERHGYYSISPQFFCLDLQIWKSIGSPDFSTSGQQQFTSTKIERSQENIHNNNTPLWLKPGDKLENYTPGYLEFGWQVIKSLIENGYTIKNISQKIRNQKDYFYPNDHYEDIDNWISDINYQPKTIPLVRYANHINKIYEEQNKTIYVLNSEDVIEQTAGTLDHYSGVCGGLKAIGILFRNGFHSKTKIDLFDISRPALQYQEYLINTWDGDFLTYYDHFVKFKNNYPNYIYAWRSWNSWENEINSFLTSAKLTRETFKETWDRYRQLNISFTEVDLLNAESVNNFFVNDPGINYVWVSNAYFMSHNVGRLGCYQLNNFYEILIEKLTSQLGKVWLEKENLLIELN